MRVIVNGGDRYETKEGESSPIYLDAEIQFPPQSSFVKVRFQLDSGSSGLGSVVLPSDILYELGLTLPVLSEIDAINADGSVEREPITKINLRFRQIPSGRPLLIEGITASLTKGGDFLLGLGALNTCNLLLSNGQIALLEFNPKAMNR